MTTTETATQIPSPRRDTGPEEAVDTAIDEACRTLHLPMIRSRVQGMASEAMRQRSSYKDFLADLLEAECAEREERRKLRLVREANFPRPKRLEDFDFEENPNVTPELVGTRGCRVLARSGRPAFARVAQGWSPATGLLPTRTLWTLVGDLSPEHHCPWSPRVPVELALDGSLRQGQAFGE